MRGTRPWDQFLDYCEKVGHIEGSETYAAMLNDGRLQDVFARRLDQIGEGEPQRPQLLGYSRVAQQLHRVEVAVVAMHRSLVREPSQIPLPQGPVFPAERYRIEHELTEQQQQDREFDATMADIFAAMKH